ncbi:MAG: type I DNA topoisomerase, partial [Candidatus Pacebacteria bacterium]|nr:type I DNA topoisomerase [Candidatus Paceibacterota bacterium]
LGIDTEKNFEPQYVIPTKARKQVNKLKKEAAKAEEVILATDEDREGEAIAYHLAEVLDLKKKESEGKVKRIAFHEITEEAIAEALKNPREINYHLVNAQQARRILDRIVGYKLSPFLWKKVMRGLSAGRVQSVAVRLIAEREKEIRNFKPEEYYTISGLFTFTGREPILFNLYKIGNDAIEKPGIKGKERAEEIVADLKEAKHKVFKITKKEVKRNPLPPFITSTLQQEGVRRLGFSSKKTMMLAQRLYENGLITYMRTDSLNISKEALAMAGKLIKEKYGEKYSLPKPRIFTGKSKLAQEAHEAIRPAKPKILPEDISADKDEKKLYDLIWKRFISSQMTQAVMSATTIELMSEKEKRKYIFRANGNIMVFDGFLKVWPASVKEEILPEIKEKEIPEKAEIKEEQHFTEPPARYNEASLIKTMEENGIGRPSTYASIISVIQLRNYVKKNEQKRFEPTEIGEKINDLLMEHFPKIVDIGFTADIEEELDEIALGVSKWQEVVKEFYDPFEKRLLEKYEEVEKKDIMPEEKTDEKCEKCGKAMVIKIGRFGKFMACSGFPECKNTKKVEGGGAIVGRFEPQKTGLPCPDCKIGEIVSRRVSKGRARGKIFWGCSRYPDCKYASWENPTQEKNK